MSLPEPVVEDPRARQAALLARATADLADVEHAMARLDDGTYGRCEACDLPIDDDLLAATPARRLCGACAPT